MQSLSAAKGHGYTILKHWLLPVAALQLCVFYHKVWRIESVDKGLAGRPSVGSLDGFGLFHGHTKNFRNQCTLGPVLGKCCQKPGR